MIRAIALASALALFAATGQAQSVQDSIVRQLTEQGFSEIRISRTWLGRSRIVARSEELYREIIVNPSTGEILRDYWRQNDGSSGNRPAITDLSDDGEADVRISNPNQRRDDDDDRDSWNGGNDDDDGDWGGGDDGDSDRGDSDGGESDGGDSDGGDSDGGDSDGGDSDGGDSDGGDSDGGDSDGGDSDGGGDDD